MDRRFFNSIAAANKYVETFTFKKDCSNIQIDIIENCKKKISIRSSAYAKLITKFLFDGFWKENRWIEEQFIEILELFLALKLTVTHQKNRGTLILQTILNN